MSQTSEDRIQEIYAHLVICQRNAEVVRDEISSAEGRLQDLKDERSRNQSAINEWHEELKSIFRMGEHADDPF